MEMALHAPTFNWLVPYMPYLLGLQSAVGCSGPWVVWSVLVWCGVVWASPDRVSLLDVPASPAFVRRRADGNAKSKERRFSPSGYGS